MAAQLAAHALQLTSFEAQQPLLYLINAVLFAGWGSWLIYEIPWFLRARFVSTLPVLSSLMVQLRLPTAIRHLDCHRSISHNHLICTADLMSQTVMSADYQALQHGRPNRVHDGSKFNTSYLAIITIYVFAKSIKISLEILMNFTLLLEAQPGHARL